MSDSAAFILTITIAATGCLLYTALCKIKEAIVTIAKMTKDET